MLGPERRDDAAAQWRALHERVDPAGLVTSWEWTGAWLEQWGRVVDHRFLVAEREGRVVGMALLTRDRPRHPLLEGRSLHVGTAGEPRGETVYVEHNRLLCAGEDRDAFAAAILAAAREMPPWERLVLDGFLPEDAAAFRRAAPALLPALETSPYLDLARARELDGDVTAALRPSVRRRVRQAQRAFGELQSEWAQTSDHALDILDELVELHTARWRADGQPGAFGSQRYVAFHRALAVRLTATGQVILFRTRAGERTVGCLLCHVDRNDVLFHQSGFGQFADNRQRAGLVTHVAGMQACLERGYDAYDFLAGEARYKSELSSDQRSLVWATLNRRTPRAVVMTAARETWRRVKGRRARVASPGGA